MRSLSFRSWPERAGRFAKEIVYPRTCAVCDKRGVWLCDTCKHDWLPLVPALCCARCGHPLLGRRCMACKDMHPGIVRARAVAAYDGWPKQMVQRFKYDRERDRSEDIAGRMLTALEALGDIDVLVPVPLHISKMQDRGFNQSEQIARRLSAVIGSPVEHALVRVKQTQSQTKLNRQERQANLRGAMAPNPAWRADPAMHYVLVDDVYTTGTTTGACVEQLEAAGVERISVLTFMVDLSKWELERYRRLMIAAGLK